MEKRLEQPSSVIGEKIERITSTRIKTHPDTGNGTFHFFVHLSSGLIVQLLQGDLLACGSPPKDGSAAEIRVVDGPRSVASEKIVAVVRRRLQIPPQIALILSSGRAMMTVFTCDGGNLVHVES